MSDASIALKVSRLPEGVDSDEYLLANGKDAYLQLLETSGKYAFEFLTDHALEHYGNATPEAKVKVTEELMPLIDKVSNAVLRGEWIRLLAQRLRVSEDTLIEELRRLKRPLSGKIKLPAEAEAGAPARAIRSAEEEIVQLVAAHPHLRAAVKETLFRQERCRMVYSLLFKDVPVSEIVNHLDEETMRWFTELVLEEKSYAAPEQMLNDLLRDLQQKDLEKRRQELEKEVVQMINGRIPVDKEKIEQYRDLNRQLKGSVRS
jgi:DNA primase